VDLLAIVDIPATMHALPNLFASGSAVSVDFDLTFVAQFLLFATFVQLMRPLLFQPLLRVFEERERRTEGAKRAAREMDERAGELYKDYEIKLEDVRRTASLERERLRSETAKLEAQIMAEARAEAAQILDRGKAQIASEVAALRRDLDRNKPALASEIASKVLGREVAR
jgi:F-type H+-transporting ATPase subunit b